MKKVIISLVVLISIFSSCNKEEMLSQSDGIEISDNENWTTENFKTNFTIQFPNNYEGLGMVGFEGNFFNKNRIDGKVDLAYNFCGPTYCDDFGALLATPIPISIISKDKQNNEVLLNLKKEFSLTDDIKGVLFYNSELSSTGKFYMKVDSEYLEGLTIYFDNTEYQEVENIIKSIAQR